MFHIFTFRPFERACGVDNRGYSSIIGDVSACRASDRQTRSPFPGLVRVFATEPPMSSYAETLISRLQKYPAYLSPAQVAQALEMSKGALALRRMRGCAPAFEKVPTGKIIYPRDDVIAWLRTGRTPD